MYRFTHLTRIIDLRLRYHRVMAVIVAGSFFLEIGSGIGPALRAAGAALLGWALARELHPDSNPAAIVASIGSGLFESLVGGVSLGVVYILLVFLRVLIRTTGAEPTKPDLALNLIVVAFVSGGRSALIASLGLATALYLSPMLPKTGPNSLRSWSVVYALVALVGFGFSSPPDQPSATGAGWLLAVVSTLLAVGLLPEERPSSVGDMDRTPLDGVRLRVGRIEIVAVMSVIAAFTLGSGIGSIAPGFWAIGATGAYGIRHAISER